ncbi:MAG: hypothetical protein JW742_07005 [Candidatus Aminicenantes bacterium]|nr:hypothetical protein [Candidatus Aminicenantes bacterium]
MIFESHLLSMVVYAALAAVVLALIRRPTPKARLRYGLAVFAIMVGGGLLFGWFMYLFTL